MLRYTTPDPTPHLNLTVRYKESEKPGVWIGFVAEVGGIFMQSGSVEELFTHTIEAATVMLNRYKREEAFDVLRKQGHDLVDTGQPIAFTLSDGEPLPNLF